MCRTQSAIKIIERSRPTLSGCSYVKERGFSFQFCLSDVNTPSLLPYRCIFGCYAFIIDKCHFLSSDGETTDICIHVLPRPLLACSRICFRRQCIFTGRLGLQSSAWPRNLYGSISRVMQPENHRTTFTTLLFDA